MADRILSPEEIRAKILQYESVLPSIVIQDLEKTMTTMKLTESKADEIIQKTLELVSPKSESERIEDITVKLDMLENELNEIVKFLQSTQVQRISQQLHAMEKESVASQTPMQIRSPPTSSMEVREIQQGRQTESKEKEEDKLVISQRQPPEKLVLLTEVRDDMVSKTILLKWVEFLINKVGKERLPEILDYYLDIGWINEDIIMKVLAYAKGIEKSKGQRTGRQKMTTEDHLRSLLYIEKLKGKNIDHHMISQIKRMIEYGIERRIEKE